MKPIPNSKSTPKSKSISNSQSYIDEDLDQYEDDGFIVDDVDNCEDLQRIIRQMVRPQGYDPALTISFLTWIV